MIIFISGKDKYRSLEKFNEIFKKYKNQDYWINSFTFDDLKKINSENLNFSAFLFQNNIFTKKRVIVFLGCLLDQNFLKQITEYRNILANSNDIFIFFEEEDLKINKNLFKDFQDKVKFYNFDFLLPYELKKWIEKKTKENNFYFEKGAFEKFIEYINEDLFEAQNALEKIFAFKNYGKTGDFKIKNEDIEILFRKKNKAKIFDTIEQISKKNKKGALKLLQEHYDKGDSPLYIFSMIIYQFRNLILLSYLLQKEKKILPFQIEKIQKRTGLSLFVIKKSLSILEKFTFVELKKIFSFLFQLDSQVKSGKIDPELALKLFIAQI
ncbi:MAG: DNA polymerase III subunit delta [Minisyncoccia bacterium]